MPARQFIPLTKNTPVTHLLTLPSPPDQCLVAGLGRRKIIVWDLVTGQSVQEARPRPEPVAPRTGRLVRSLITAAPVTSIVHTTSGGNRLHIGGSAGLAALTFSAHAPLY